MGLSIRNRGDKFSIAVPLNAANFQDRWVWIAPFACKLVGVTEIHTVVSGASGSIGIRRFTVDGSLPNTAANGTTIVELLPSQTTSLVLTGLANTIQTVSLSTVSGALNIPSGARIAFDLAGTAGSFDGCVVTMTFQAS